MKRIDAGDDDGEASMTVERQIERYVDMRLRSPDGAIRPASPSRKERILQAALFRHGLPCMLSQAKEEALVQLIEGQRPLAVDKELTRPDGIYDFLRDLCDDIANDLDMTVSEGTKRVLWRRYVRRISKAMRKIQEFMGLASQLQESDAAAHISEVYAMHNHLLPYYLLCDEFEDWDSRMDDLLEGRVALADSWNALISYASGVHGSQREDFLHDSLSLATREFNPVIPELRVARNLDAIRTRL